MEPYKLVTDFKLETFSLVARPLKLVGEWDCELKQNLTEYYGSRHIWKAHRCYKNALKAEARGDFRRSNYWLRQGARYHRMKRD